MKFIFRNLEEIVASLCLIVTTALVVVNIVCRYFFNIGLPWTEEAATGFFVWSVFIGAVACFKHRAHVGVDMIVNCLPRKMRNGVFIFMDMLLVVLNVYMAYLAIVFISHSYAKPTAMLGISSAYISSAVVLAFIAMSIYSIAFVVNDFRGRRYLMDQEG